MSHPQQLANRLRECILNGTWIANTNWKKQIENLNWEEATFRYEKSNSIADLTFHIYYYIQGVSHYFKTGKLTISDKYSFDYPPIQSQKEWQKLQESLFNETKQLAKQIEQFTEEDLNKIFFKEEYGNYLRSIDGIIEHAYYHLGQVSLLKKYIKSSI